MASTEYVNFETGVAVAGQGSDIDYRVPINLPTGYDSEATPYEWVVTFHASGGSGAQYVIGNDVVDHHLAENRVVVGLCSGNPTNWGNPDSQAQVIQCIEYIAETYNVEAKAIGHGQSMGGLNLLNTVRNRPDLLWAGLGLWPVTNLQSQYDGTGTSFDRTDAMEAAWSCTAETWDAVSEGHDPHDFFLTFATQQIPIAIWHGDADVSVYLAQNSEAFDDGVNALTADLVTLTTIAGAGHGAQAILDSYLANVEAALTTMSDWPLVTLFDFDLILDSGKVPKLLAMGLA